IRAKYGESSMSREKGCKVETEPKESPSFGHLSRRTFLSRLGATGAAAAAASPLLGLAQTQLKRQEAQTPVMEREGSERSAWQGSHLQSPLRFITPLGFVFEGYL
ncbi:MAG TPA: twin-arginine translocation signal domain-containing protein, partial [Chthoniobacterales bacterium]|nr:twin-arginine translocation signal domain-containing protein [Chthoniobacterales bacterium]